MQPNFSSSGKYPSLKHRLIICEIIGDIMWLQDSSTDVEITYSPFPLSFKLDIAFEISKGVLGAKKKEFCTLF